MRTKLLSWALAGLVGALTLGAVATPAHAGWYDRYGYWHPGVRYVYAPRVVVAPPVVVAPRVWVPRAYVRGVWVGGYWR
jgi:hypothetical protein